MGFPIGRDGRRYSTYTPRGCARRGPLATDVDIDTLAEVTGNDVGAEIKGWWARGQSHALARYLKDADDVGGDATSASPSTESSSSSSSSKLNVTMDDFTRAMREVRPAMGADEEALASMRAEAGRALPTHDGVLGGVAAQAREGRDRPAAPRGGASSSAR